jgi:hypothetical protein
MNAIDKTVQEQIWIELKKIIAVDERRGRICKPEHIWRIEDQRDFSNIPIATLLDDPYYLGLGQQPCAACKGTGKVFDEPCMECNGKGELRPELFISHRQDIMDLWNARKTNSVTTAIFQEGIGSGKTTKFCVILWLMVAEVLTKVRPLEYYGLAKKGQGISFVCMSRNEILAKAVTFLTLLPFFSCPFFDEYFPPQVDLTVVQEKRRFPSRLLFPKQVVIFPGTGSALSAIGFNLFGGGVDEANYLEVIDDSKKALTGKQYDAAEAMHNNIKARMKSRFDPHRLKRNGKTPGILVMFSNPKHSGDFTSRMGVKSKRDDTIFFRKRCTWQAQPADRFSGEYFWYDSYNRKIVETKNLPPDHTITYEPWMKQPEPKKIKQRKKKSCIISKKKKTITKPKRSKNAR